MKVAVLVLLVLLAGCVQIPEEPKPIAAPQETPPATNAAPAEQPAAQNATAPLAPLPAGNKTVAAASLPKATVVSTAASSNGTSASGWTTEPLQVEEGGKLRVVIRKTT